ncbi:sugar transporter [Acinetobacter johnsonii]|uniref:lipopolysaccharide biosynthesis protein n=1 Tax=Acinetobacter johnsonii TaxID=40214 RepID=UPI002FD890B2|nr:sugar transporter [Acinetobacter johnsonii]
MKKIGRTSKVLKNAKISLLFVLILLFLNFISRSVFINTLGPEILGLNTIATNLIGFLNLAELGIAAAIASSLYRPLAENNKEAIAEIIAVQGWMYKNIAYIIMISAFFLMFFFPIIFEKIEISLWYAYSIFGVLLLSSLLTYFITYKQVLLVADMKEYKVIFVVKGAQIIKITLQILALIYLSNGFLFWIMFELIYGICSAMILKKIIEKEYPWLNIKTSEGKKLKDKHSIIIRNTKQLFFHKFSGFVLLQTTPLIIFAYASLTTVSMYDNYMMIILGVTTLVGSIFSSFQPAIGSLVAKENSKKILEFFYEYAVLRYWIASIICVVFYFQAHDFVELWLGNEFILSGGIFNCLVIYLFIALTRVLEPFTYAYGLYSDIYAPIIEAILNLTLSLILGYFFGLVGILIGVIISLILVVCIWKPFYMFTRGFKYSVLNYFKKIILYIIGVFLGFLLVENFNYLFVTNDDSIVSFIKNTVLISLIYSIIIFMLFYMLFPEFRSVSCRVKYAILKKYN